MNKWSKAYIIAGILDALDYVAMAWIPIAGDMLDFIGMLVMYPLIGNHAMINLVEFVPTADLLPTFVISTYMAQNKMVMK